MKRREDPIIAKITDWSRKNCGEDVVWWNTRAERSTSLGDRGYCKRLGVKAGLPDLVYFWPGVALGMEVKYETDLHGAQPEMLARLKNIGWHITVVRSEAEAIAFFALKKMPLKSKKMLATMGDCPYKECNEASEAKKWRSV